MAPVNLVRNHDEFVNAVKLRLTKLEVTPVIYLLTAVYQFMCFCYGEQTGRGPVHLP
jgi:hypothetical protein